MLKEGGGRRLRGWCGVDDWRGGGMEEWIWVGWLVGRCRWGGAGGVGVGERVRG